MKFNYKKVYSLLACSLIACLACFGQWTHDFSTDDLSDWSGDVSDFIVNNDNQLQLNAPAAGDAYIYRSSPIDFDTISFSMYHLMDFAPSDNNRSRIYLALSNNDLAIARGYFIEIGENGSADALNFYYLDNGNEVYIASATMGAMTNEPAVVRIQIDIYPDGFWTIKTNYEGEDFTTLELEFVDDQFLMEESNFFGLSCKFSASRADKFFYDDIAIQKFVPDTSPPLVTDALPINSNDLRVTFSEPVVESDGTNTANYSINNGIGAPASIVKIGDLGNQYQLTFAEAFDASQLYILDVSGISDLNDNLMEDQGISFFLTESPSVGDLFVSEVLFDPYPNGEDFVEIYNRSSKSLDLSGVSIRNAQNEESKTINSITMLPGTYLALSEEVDFLFQEYKPDADSNIEFQDLPAFNNDQGNVTLINNSGIVLDSFDYNEDQHFQLIDDTEGVSLERVSFKVEAGDERNWQSAAESVRFATPGYENSNTVIISGAEQNFELVKEIFSPNQDGDDDQMILTYNLDKSGYLANITVYDAAGFKIKNLSSNELLGNQGIITWDGTTEENQISDIGIYIIIGNVFHSDGETLNFKLTTVLADFID